ncbi:MAG: LamG-like jellyroll fold domain-containing protein [Ilumatobacteraceae bacterium]
MSDGLLALYTFDEGSGTKVTDVSGNGAPLDLTIANPGNVTWGSGTLTINSATVIASSGPAAKVFNAVTGGAGTNEITVEAWVKPKSASPSTPGRIVAIGSNQSARDVVVSQGFFAGGATNVWEARAFTTADYNNKISVTNPKITTNLQHVVLSVKATGEAQLYVDDVLVGTKTTSGTFGDWDLGYPLALGNDASTGRPFLGTYHLVAVYDTALTASEVHDNFIAGPAAAAGNSRPVTSAGADATVVRPNAVALDGTVTDDGNPQPVTVTWSMVSGPGTVTFGSTTSVDTTATFDAVGTYVLRLTATDGSLSSSDDVTITVIDNAAPVVSAGADAAVEVGLPLTLAGTATDDGLPVTPGAVTTTWSQVSGPGTATFVAASSPASDVSFDQPGTYVLRLDATDGELSAFDEVEITVGLNTAPVVSAGADLGGRDRLVADDRRHRHR